MSKGKAPEAWNEDVTRTGGGFYLSADYAEIVARQGAEPLYFRLGNEGRTIGVALGFLTNQWMRWPARNIFREFQWQTHPVVADDDPKLLESFVRSILREVENIGVSRIRLHSEDARMSPADPKESVFATEARLEFRVALNHNSREVFSLFSSSKKRDIKSSTLTVSEVSTLDSVQKLIDFQNVSRERRRKRGEDYAVATRSAAERIFEDYIAPGFGRVFLSYKDGIPLSGLLLHCWQGRAYYTMSGCSQQGFRANAPLNALWGAIKQLCCDGYSELNLGGVSASATDPSNLAHGLYRFKRSFGGIETPCLTLERRVSGVRSLVRGLLDR